MSELILNSEILNRILNGHEPSQEKVEEIFSKARSDPSELFAVAQNLRKESKGNTVTFSKKAFFNLINLCKDTCTYCTYKSEPNESSASMMSKQNVQDLLHLARKYQCVEALFVTGEKPEEKYGAARTWLKQNGFSSTAEYLIYCSDLALLNISSTFS